MNPQLFILVEVNIKNVIVCIVDSPTIVDYPTIMEIAPLDNQLLIPPM